MNRLESDMEGQTNTSFRQWLLTMELWQWAQSFDEGFRYGHMTTNLVEGINTVLLKTRHLPIASNGGQQVDQIQAGHVFVEHVRDAMVINCRSARSMNVEIYSRRLETFRVTENIGRRTRSYGVDLRNRRCECRKFETLHYPCTHVVAACAKVNLDAEQYVDDVYTLERTLRVWENEFPVLPDLSTWEVPPITFELVQDRRLRRNPRGRPQSSRIRNEMDIREKSDGKRCGICRKCPVARSPLTNLNHHESYNATDTCRTGRAYCTAAGGIQTVQSRRRIRPVRSSDNIHRPPNPDDSHVNPYLTVITRDLAGGPARALPVAENNMLSAPHPARSLCPITKLAARRGDYSRLRSNHNHVRNSVQLIVPQCDVFPVIYSPVQLNSSSLCQAVIIPQLARRIRDRLDAPKLPKHPIAVIPLDDVKIYYWCVSIPYVGINECRRGYNIQNFRPPIRHPYKLHE
ncbi:hypothetical protein GOBAR_DD34319 [Gossypium barbadense]|nr:hypothetical protein GOBAR_DD34319 [Gossypium barbadense]